MNKDVVVLIPVYNPNEEIMQEFLDKLTKKFTNIVFINDGCSKKHDKFMNNLAKSYPVVKHSVNLGKGRGLKNGINYILENFSKAKVIVTADCDGQHSVKDIKKCSDIAKKNMDALVLGVRDFSDNLVPRRSKFGNVITRNVLYSFVGVKVSDTQTGLRAMSLNIAKKLIDVDGERYEYETNCLIETKSRNIPIKEVVIETIYINNNETSHFNPVKDSIRVYKLFASYLLFTLLAYIIETVIFAKTFNVNHAIYVMPLFLLFSKIVSSLVDNIIMPIIGVILGGVDFSGLSITFHGASIKYGLFIQNVVDFLIVAFCIFTVIKILNSFDKKIKSKIEKEQKEQEEKEPEMTKEERLLTEIRDLLKEK